MNKNIDFLDYVTKLKLLKYLKDKKIKYKNITVEDFKVENNWNMVYSIKIDNRKKITIYETSDPNTGNRNIYIYDR